MESSLFYKGMSKIYDLLEFTYFRNQCRNPRTQVLNFINQKDTMILDVCTGTATNAIAIAQRYKKARVIGIDRSKEMLHIAKNKVRKNEFNNIKLYEMDATKTGFEDNTFDVVLISLVLHEVPEAIAENILKETKRILKQGGKLLIIEWEEPKCFLQKIWFLPIRKLEPKGFEQFLKVDTKSYFGMFGFVISKIKHCDYTKVLVLRNIK